MKLRSATLPMDDLSIASFGAEAESVQKVMGKVIAEELDALMDQLANIDTKDANTPATWVISGQIRCLRRLQNKLRIDISEGRAAVKAIREELDDGINSDRREKASSW